MARSWKKAFGYAMVLIIPLTMVARAAEDALASPAMVYVRDVVVFNPAYQTGEEISGSILFYNPGASNLPQVYYSITLTRGYAPGKIPTQFYDTKDFDPIVLNAGEEKAILFKYQLPQGIAGKDLGLRVQTLLASGLPMGWKDIGLSVNGEDSIVDLVEAKLIANGKEYLPEQGPTVGSNANISYLARLRNRSKQERILIPRISIARHMANAPVLKREPQTPLTISPSSTIEARWDVPLESDEPGVYDGTVEFLDENGTLGAAPASFRYIVAGSAASIHSITANTASVKRGEEISVTVTYSGPAFNIDSSNTVDAGKGSLVVVLTNEAGQPIGQDISEINLNTPVASITRVIHSSGKSGRVIVTASITKEGKELATQSVPLSEPLASAPAAGGKTPLAITALIAVLVLIAAALFLFKRNRKGSGLLGIFFVATIVILSNGALVHSANALTPFQESSCENYNSSGRFVHDCPPDQLSKPTVIISEPSRDVIVGQSFYVRGRIVYTQCTNTPLVSDILVDADQWTIQPGGWRTKFIASQPISIGVDQECKGHCYRPVSGEFVSGPYRYGEEDNGLTKTISMTFRIAGWGGSYIQVKGSVTVKVINKPYAPEISRIQTGDRELTVQWSPTGSSATSFKIYRSPAPNVPIDSSTFVREVPYTVSELSQFIDTGLTNNTRYYYRVVAVNAVGESPPSREAFGIPRAKPLPPQISGDAEIIRFTEHSYTVQGSNFLENVNVKYYIDFSDLKSTAQESAPLDSTPTPSFTVAKLMDETAAEIVRAKVCIDSASYHDDVFCSDWAELRLHYLPLALRAIAGDGEVRLQWNGPPIGPYYLFRSSSPNFQSFAQDFLGSLGTSPSLTNVFSGSGNFFINTPVVNGVTYYYKAYLGKKRPMGSWDFSLLGETPSNVVQVTPNKAGPFSFDVSVPQTISVQEGKSVEASVTASVSNATTRTPTISLTARDIGSAYPVSFSAFSPASVTQSGAATFTITAPEGSLGEHTVEITATSSTGAPAAVAKSMQVVVTAKSAKKQSLMASVDPTGLLVGHYRDFLNIHVPGTQQDVAVPVNLSITKAQPANPNVYGWAWAGGLDAANKDKDTIGWISFNCANTEKCALGPKNGRFGGIDYGVRLDTLTDQGSTRELIIAQTKTGRTRQFAKLSGFAWAGGETLISPQLLGRSEYAYDTTYGWICFGETCPGTPPGELGQSKSYAYVDVDLSPSAKARAQDNWKDRLGIVDGWAKILVLGEEGWIRLGGESSGSKGKFIYPLRLNLEKPQERFKPFEGYAWSNGLSAPGSRDEPPTARAVGWVDFNCSNGSFNTTCEQIHNKSGEPAIYPSCNQSSDHPYSDCFAVAADYAPPIANLTVATFATDPVDASPEEEQAVNFRVGVANTGTLDLAASQGWNVTIYEYKGVDPSKVPTDQELSVKPIDTSASSDWKEWGSQTMSGPLAGAGSTATVTIPIKFGYGTVGPHKLWVKVDSLGGIMESNEQDNVKGLGRNFTVRSGRPDLTVQAFSITPAEQQYWDEPVTFTVDMKNNSTKPVPSDKGFSVMILANSLQTKDEHELRFGQDKTVIEQYIRPGDAPAPKQTKQIQMLIPARTIAQTLGNDAGAMPKIFYLRVLLDAGDQVVESLEKNNISNSCAGSLGGASQPFPCSYRVNAPPADLVVGAVTVSSAKVGRSNPTVALTVEARNIGFSAVAFSGANVVTTGLYRGDVGAGPALPHRPLERADKRVSAFTAFNTLAIGGSQALTASYTFPASAAAGIYTFCAYIDDSGGARGAVDELLPGELNNGSADYSIAPDGTAQQGRARCATVTLQDPPRPVSSCQIVGARPLDQGGGSAEVRWIYPGWRDATSAGEFILQRYKGNNADGDPVNIDGSGQSGIVTYECAKNFTYRVTAEDDIGQTSSAVACSGIASCPAAAVARFSVRSTYPADLAMDFGRLAFNVDGSPGTFTPLVKSADGTTPLLNCPAVSDSGDNFNNSCAAKFTSFPSGSGRKGGLADGYIEAEENSTIDLSNMKDLPLASFPLDSRKDADVDYPFALRVQDVHAKDAVAPTTPEPVPAFQWKRETLFRCSAPDIVPTFPGVKIPAITYCTQGVTLPPTPDSLVTATVEAFDRFPNSIAITIGVGDPRRPTWSKKICKISNDVGDEPVCSFERRWGRWQDGFFHGSLERQFILPIKAFQYLPANTTDKKWFMLLQSSIEGGRFLQLLNFSFFAQSPYRPDPPQTPKATFTVDSNNPNTHYDIALSAHDTSREYACEARTSAVIEGMSRPTIGFINSCPQSANQSVPFGAKVTVGLNQGASFALPRDIGITIGVGEIDRPTWSKKLCKGVNDNGQEPVCSFESRWDRADSDDQWPYTLTKQFNLPEEALQYLPADSTSKKWFVRLSPMYAFQKDPNVQLFRIDASGTKSVMKEENVALVQDSSCDESALLGCKGSMNRTIDLTSYNELLQAMSEYQWLLDVKQNSSTMGTTSLRNFQIEYMGVVCRSNTPESRYFGAEGGTITSLILSCPSIPTKPIGWVRPTRPRTTEKITTLTPILNWKYSHGGDTTNVQTKWRIQVAHPDRSDFLDPLIDSGWRQGSQTQYTEIVGAKALPLPGRMYRWRVNVEDTFTGELGWQETSFYLMADDRHKIESFKICKETNVDQHYCSTGDEIYNCVPIGDSSLVEFGDNERGIAYIPCEQDPRPTVELPVAAPPEIKPGMSVDIPIMVGTGGRPRRGGTRLKLRAAQGQSLEGMTVKFKNTRQERNDESRDELPLTILRNNRNAAGNAYTLPAVVSIKTPRTISIGEHTVSLEALVDGIGTNESVVAPLQFKVIPPIPNALCLEPQTPVQLPVGCVLKNAADVPGCVPTSAQCGTNPVTRTARGTCVQCLLGVVQQRTRTPLGRQMINVTNPGSDAILYSVQKSGSVSARLFDEANVERQNIRDKSAVGEDPPFSFCVNCQEPYDVLPNGWQDWLMGIVPNAGQVFDGKMPNSAQVAASVYVNAPPTVESLYPILGSQLRPDGNGYYDYHPIVDLQKGKEIANPDARAYDHSTSVRSDGTRATKALRPKFSWQFNDLDTGTDNKGITNLTLPDHQTAYRLQVFDASGATVWDTNAPARDADETALTAHSGSVKQYPADAPALFWDTLYQWRVRVADANGGVSPWSERKSFRTPLHADPVADFTTVPKLIVVNTGVLFNNLSKCFTISNPIGVPLPCVAAKYLWIFGDPVSGSARTSTIENPQSQYDESERVSVTLTVVDQDGYTSSPQTIVLSPTMNLSCESNNTTPKECVAPSCVWQCLRVQSIVLKRVAP